MIGFDRRKQTTKRGDNLGIVGVIEIGEAIPPKPIEYIDRGITYRLDKFGVVATPHNRNWPGTDSPITFAVEGYGFKDNFYGVLYMWGFFDEQSCYDFLNGIGPKQYPVYDRFGTPGMCEPRKRLGIPDTYIRRYKESANC